MEEYSEEGIKRAIRKSRVLYNRGADGLTTEAPPQESALARY